MPIYDYECPACSHIKAGVLRFVSTAEAPSCPECGTKMEKIWSSFEPRFKGSGFYETDYKDKPKPPQISQEDH